MRHFEFEVFFGHPSEDIHQATEHSSWKFRSSLKWRCKFVRYLGTSSNWKHDLEVTKEENRVKGEEGLDLYLWTHNTCRTGRWWVCKGQNFRELRARSRQHYIMNATEERVSRRKEIFIYSSKNQQLVFKICHIFNYQEISEKFQNGKAASMKESKWVVNRISLPIYSHHFRIIHYHVSFVKQTINIIKCEKKMKEEEEEREVNYVRC